MAIRTEDTVRPRPGEITCGHPECDNTSHTVQLDLMREVKLSDAWRKRPLGCRIGQHGHYRKYTVEDPGDNNRRRTVKECLCCTMRWWSY